MSEPMSSPEAYAESGGGYCPLCLETEVGYGSCDFEGNPAVVAQKVWCKICGAEWWDEYLMRGYADLTVPLPEKEN